YKPNSYRAKNCIEGRDQLVRFCQHYNIKHEICGKVIVATKEKDIARLDDIVKTVQINYIDCIRKIDPEVLAEIEPYAKGVKAIHVPCSGIVDYTGICKQLRMLIEEKGNKVCCRQEVEHIAQNTGGLVVQTKTDRFATQYLINCAGLYSDH